jgi:hypothetical protein
MFESSDVVMGKLVELAREKGDNQFTVRINAKRGNSAIPINLAYFKGASIENLNSLESWLPRLVGGGEYMVVTTHETDASRRFPFSVNLNGNPFPQPNALVVQAPDWTGPTNLVSPNPLMLASDAQITAQAQQQAQAAAQQQAQGFATPNVPLANPFAPRAPAPVAAPAVPHVPVTNAGAQAFQQIAQQDTRAAESLLVAQRYENAGREALAAKEAELNRRESEDRIRREAADREGKLKADMDAKLKVLETQYAQRPVEKAGPGTMEMFSALAAALAPIAQSIIASNQANAARQQEMAQRQAEMQLKMQQDTAAIQQKMQEQQNALMLKAMEKPSGTPPEMQALFDMARINAESQAAMMTQVINATGMVSKMSIGMIETIADLTAPPEGSPIADAVKEGVKALSALAAGADAGARKSVQAQQKQLPAQGPTQAQVVAAQQQRAAAINAQAQAEQNGLARAQAAAQTAQANVVQFPQPAPTQAPVAQPEPQQENAAFGDADMPGGFDHIEEKDPVQELEDLIRERHEPTDAVAAFFFDHMNSPAVQGALKKVNGDPNALLAERLGAVWLLANQDYVEQLVESIQRVGSERGLFEEDEDGTGTDQ